ncbi:unnamed protein product, partial [Laminaria digitata]
MSEFNLSPDRLASSRTYVALMAAAAEEARVGGGVGVGAGVGVGGGKRGRGEGVSQKEETRLRDRRMRQLEAENLRLRFRVADLEGQVSVMEDELDRRGPRPFEAAAAYPWFTGGAAGGGGGGGRAGTGDGGGGGNGAVTSPAATAAVAVMSPMSDGSSSEGGGGGGKGGGGAVEPPPLSPRGKGYLARLVLEVCSEMEDAKKVGCGGVVGVVASTAKAAGSGAAMPRSERLCKVLPKVMETAIRGVQDLDEQV